ncbi:MAG: family 78 glycoside hydrolase catalytic domain [Armatimonadota bacterium]
MSYKGKPLVANRSRSIGRDNWSAGWIWCEGESRPRNFYLHARKTFKLDSKPERARLRITADSRYKLYINGSFVGSGPVPSDPHRLSYDIYDIGALLTKGQNVIAVLIHHLGQGTYSYIPGRAAFICEADIELENGSEKIVTDETWRTLPSPAWTSSGARMSRRLGFQEVYDASLEPVGWTEVKFKDAKWPQAVVLGKHPMHPFDRLVPRDIPHLREELVRPVAVVSLQDCPALPENLLLQDVPGFMADETLTPLTDGRVSKPERFISDKDEAVTITVPQSGGVSVILDFGREVHGSIELAFTRSHGGTVDIGYSEALEDGRVKPNKDDIRYTDRLLLRKGRQEWRGFDPRGFRYVQLDLRNCPKPVAISRVAVHETSYPVEWKGSFESSDELLNKIWKTAAETVRLSMQDTYIDSPWREHAQWWDNAAVASRTAYYVFGDNLLLKQGLRHIAASQDKDGAIYALYPSATKELFPDFGAIWVMSVWECYAQDEDKGLLSDLYPVVVKWLKWIGQFTDSDGLLANVRGDLFIDWAEIDRRGEVMALNCLYIGALRAACRMAETLQRRYDAEEWAGLASALKMVMAKYFWSPSLGLFADARVNGRLEEHYSRQTNILAALYDIADHYQKSSIYRQVLSDRYLPPITTPYFTSVLAEGLFRNGYAEQAVSLIRNRWGGMLSQGATAFWEYLTTEGCLCYGSASAPAYHLQAYILGIKPSGEPRRVIIEPHPADLDWAKGVVPTKSGPVAVNWAIGKRGITMTVEVPRGVTAELIPPRLNQPCRVIVDGKDRFDINMEIGPGTHNIQIVKGVPSKSRRQRKPEPDITLVERPPVPPGRADIETVEQMIRILAELESEVPAVVVEEPVAEEPSTDKRKRHRRRGKRSKSSVQVQVKEAVGEPQEAEVVIASEVSDTEAPAAPVKKRSSRRRRRKSSSQTEEPAVTAQPVEAAAEPVQQQEAVEEAKPAKRRRRRSSKSQSAEAKPQAEEQVTPAVIESADQSDATTEPVEATSEPAPERKRSSRRRRRKPSAHTAESVPETAVTEEQQPVVVEAEPPVEHAEDANVSEKKPQKRYRRRRTKPSPQEDLKEGTL